MGTLRFAIFCNGDLEMGGLDSIRFVNAVDGGLLGQLRGGKGLFAAIITVAEDVEGRVDALHCYPARRGICVVH